MTASFSQAQPYFGSGTSTVGTEDTTESTEPPAPPYQDFEAARAILVNDGLATNQRYSDLDMTQIISDQRTDGSWLDIEYDSSQSSGWQPAEHLRRVNSMTRAYLDDQSSYYNNASVLSSISQSLTFWNDTAPRSQNWWWNEIGKQLLLTSTVLRLEDQLDRTLVDNTVEQNWVRSGVGTQPNQGQNLVWRALNTMARAVVEEDQDRFNKAALAVVPRIEPLRVNHPALLDGSGGGIMPDYSFVNHGRLVYNGGYGLQYAITIAELGSLSRYSRYPVTEYRESVLSKFLLEGMQYFVRGKTIDYNTVGRNLTREGYVDRASSMVPVLELFREEFQLPRNGQIQKFIDRIVAAENGEARPDTFSSHKHFFNSDITVQHRPEYYTSVRFATDTTIAAETINGEGLRSRYQGDGVNLFYRDGDEYDGIFPVWNWRRLPGTTLEQKPWAPGPAPVRLGFGETNFGGGVSNGAEGITSHIYSRDGIEANKSWLFLDDGVLGLGSGINAPNTSYETYTTLNQTWSDGIINIRAANQNFVYDPSVVDGLWQLSGVDWVHHDDIAYFFFDNTPRIRLGVEQQTGSWADINVNGSTDILSESVFTLAIDHGIMPVNDIYRYLVVPGLELNEVDRYYSQLETNFDFLRLDEDVHAVRDNRTGLIHATFFSPDTLDLGDDIEFRALTPAHVILNYISYDEFELTVASPIEYNTIFSGFMFDRSPETNADGSGNSNFLFRQILLNLGEGDSAGQSATFRTGIAVPSPTGLAATLCLMGLALKRRR